MRLSASASSGVAAGGFSNRIAHLYRLAVWHSSRQRNGVYVRIGRQCRLKRPINRYSALFGSRTYQRSQLEIRASGNLGQMLVPGNLSQANDRNPDGLCAHTVIATIIAPSNH